MNGVRMETDNNMKQNKAGRSLMRINKYAGSHTIQNSLHVLYKAHLKNCVSKCFFMHTKVYVAISW